MIVSLLIRIVFFLLLVFFFIKIIKKLFMSPQSAEYRFTQRERQDRQPEAISEMVQDPVCKVYIPRHEAVSAEISGGTHYFCSKKCLQAFKKNQKQ